MKKRLQFLILVLLLAFGLAILIRMLRRESSAPPMKVVSASFPLSVEAEVDLTRYADTFVWEGGQSGDSRNSDSPALLAFDFRSGPSWKAQGGRLSVKDGVLWAEAPKRQEMVLYSPEGLNLDSRKAIGLGLSLKTNARGIPIRFRREGKPKAENSKTRLFSQEADVRMDYFVPTHNINFWAGKIDQFILIVPKNSYVAIDRFEVLSSSHYFSGSHGSHEYPFRAEVYKGCKILRKCIYVKQEGAFTLPRIRPDEETMVSVCCGRLIAEGTTTFRVSALDGEQEHLLLEFSPTDAKDWPEKRISLRPLAGKEIQLKFSSQVAQEDVALWGAPKLYRARSAPNLVLYLIDTLRPDVMGCYDEGHREYSPRIDAFAEQSLLFKRAYSASNTTRPTISSLMSGLSVPAHGNVNYGQEVFDVVPTLPQILQEQGWHTAAFVANPNFSQSNLCRGFDECFLLFAKQFGVGPQFIDVVNDWISRQGDRPFFLYVHTMENHGYDRSRAPQPYQFLAYKERTKVSDQMFGSFLDALDAAGVQPRTSILLTADHGEAFLEHGTLTHGGENLYQELVHVPLILDLPDRISTAAVIEQNVSLLDVFPTILDLVEYDSDSALLFGRSLLPLLEGKDDVSEWASRPLLLSQGWLHGIVQGDYKFIRTAKKSRGELYNCVQDSLEKNNLAGEEKPLYSQLNKTLDHLMAEQTGFYRDLEKVQREINQQADMVFDTEVLEELEALGYIR